MAKEYLHVLLEYCEILHSHSNDGSFSWEMLLLVGLGIFEEPRVTSDAPSVHLIVGPEGHQYPWNLFLKIIFI